MRDYTQLQTAGNAAGLEKLKQNEHKDDWKDLRFDELYIYLVQEVLELKQAFEAKEITKDGYANIRAEAADIRNFSDMIILKCDERIGDADSNS